MYNFKLNYLILILLSFHGVICEISDKRICADKNCKEPISLAKTLLRYSSPEPRVLSFLPNAEVKIFSKEAVSTGRGYWEAEINGKRGYVPEIHVREYKILSKETITVNQEQVEPLGASGDISEKPTPESDQKQPDVSDGAQTNLTPDKVKDSYEVVDGTTIFSESSSFISPSSTEAPVHSTFVVPGNSESVNASNSDEEKNPNESISKDVVTEVAQNVLINAVNSDKETENSKDAPAKDIIDEKTDSVIQKAFSWMTSEPKDISDEEEDEEEEDEDEIDDEEDEEETEISEDEEQNIASETPQNEKLPATGSENGNSSPVETATQNIASETIPTGGDKDNTRPVEATTQNEASITVPEEKLNATGANKDNSLPVEAATQNEAAKTVPEENVTVADEENFLPVETTTQMPNVDTEKEDSMPTSQVTTPASVEGTTTASEDAEELPFDQTVTPDPSILTTQMPIDVAETTIGNSNTGKLPEDSPSASNIQDPSDDSTASTTVFDSQEKLENEQLLPIENVPVEGASSLVYNLFNSAAQVNVSSDGGSNNSEVTIGESIENAETLDHQASQFEASSEASTVETTLSSINDTKTEEFAENIGDDESSSNNPTENITESNLGGDENLTDHSIDENIEETPRAEEKLVESGSIFSGLLALFSSDNTEEVNTTSQDNLSNVDPENIVSSPAAEPETGYCNVDTCKRPLATNSELYFNYDLFLYLTTSAISCIIFLFMYLAMDKSKRLKPLIAKINELEKELLITLKEKEMLEERAPREISENENTISSDTYDLLTQKLTAVETSKQVLEMEVIRLQQAVEGKQALEQQIEMLEKELETSTEVGMELNRIISEMLDPADGSERLKENVEQLQRQLLEQKMTIEESNNLLSAKEADNLLLLGDLEASKNKIRELAGKLDELVEQVSKIQANREHEQKSLQDEVAVYQHKYNEGVVKNEMLTNDIQTLKAQLGDSQRQAELRIKEYNILKDSLKSIKSMSSDKAALHSLLDTTSMKAEFQQLKIDNENYLAQLKQEQAAKMSYEKNCQALLEDNQSLMKKYQGAEKEKVEVNMKLEVLNNYFKKREEELQGDILKYKSIWDTKEGEATSTTERIKLMQEEIENYKSQNDILKQEIISQEIDLKSQISMLEKKVHENWVNARQTERKLEDARQEAAQLRNRITLRERNQNRLQSPAEHQNGDPNSSAVAADSFDSPASPPLLFDRLARSPPFLPPPPGAPFLPPPPHGLPFMPPPPAMFPPPPGDRRPPPLGRLSSPPPMGSRYSPDSSAFSPYDRNSPSPPYDSEYGASPPPMRRYSPYERREYQRAGHASNGRNQKGSMMSSGSDHSVESIEKVSRKQSKMV